MSQAPLNADHVRKVYNGFFADGSKDYTYDRWQRTDESKYQFAQSMRVFQRAIFALEAKNALEVGCGDGLWTRSFLPHVGALTCLDISSEMLRRAEKKLADLEPMPMFLEGDFLRNTFHDQVFDAILSFRSFEYFEDKQKGLQEFARVLAPKGTLILVTKSPQYDWKGYFKTKTLHQGVMDIRIVKRSLQEQGLDVMDIYPAIVGKLLATVFGRFIGHIMQWFFVATRRFFPLSLSRYVTESYLIVARKRS